MKRDLELIRKLLQRIEVQADWEHEVDMKFEGYNASQVMYNAHLALQHGLIEGQSFRSGGSLFITVQPRGLTWEGHEFLDSIRNDFVWKKALQTVKRNGGSVSFKVLQDIVQTSTKSKLGLSD